MAMQKYFMSRRALLRGLGLFSAGVAVNPLLSSNVFADDKPLKTIKLAWGQTAVCQAPISVALKQGFFKKYGLNVEPVNFSGPTDALLQAIATGQADGGIGMALRWLKPLEQGFDVDLTVGTHGGCMRLLTPQNSGIRDVKDLVGKSVAVSDQASPIRNFFAVQLAKQGIDPDKQVNWLQYPPDLFGEALRKGEVQALATDDPQGWLLKKQHNLLEVDNNLKGEYATMTCWDCAVRWCATILPPHGPSLRPSSMHSNGRPIIPPKPPKSSSPSCQVRCRWRTLPRCSKSTLTTTTQPVPNCAVKSRLMLRS